MSNLLIVESPAKIKKIKEFLGSGWDVIASVGHFRDLPKKEIGVEPPDFKPHYVNDPDKEPVIKRIKDSSKVADTIYLATDPDREGEAIAWHIQEIIKGVKCPVHRITFNSITKSSVIDAISKPRKLDLNLVHAQEARRVIDRLVGYKVTPILWNISNDKMSAGRVQSVALRIVTDNEKEILSFKPTTHFGVNLSFDGWNASLKTKPFIKEESEFLIDKKIAVEIARCSSVIVKYFEEKDKKVAPPPPFITSTLQRACSVALGISIDRTMKLIQKLYEGGHITYIRTDSPNLSSEGFEAIKQYCSENEIQCLDKQRVWNAKESAQEAHEAIRPTHFEILDAGEDEESKKIYKLIWCRAVASQMPDAVFSVRKIELESVELFNQIHALFTAQGSKIKFEGWKSLTKKDSTSEEDDEEENPIPYLEKDSSLSVSEGKVIEKVTTPKKRFTQASLVETLEKSGIGRPATYADIFSKIIKRDYIEEREVKGSKQKFLFPTDKGFLVADSLVNAGFSFMNLNYTKDIESELDRITNGEVKYLAVVSSTYEILERESSKLKGTVKAQENLISCPACKTGHLRRRCNKDKQFFWGCSNYQEGCKETYPDVKGAPMLSKDVFTCPKCKKPLKARTGSKGLFWACTGYPDCTFTAPDEKGRPSIGVPCPAPGCDGFLVRRKSDKYDFFSCNRFPKCDYSCQTQNGKPKIGD